MGIGQEPSSSDPEIDNLGDTQSEPEEETKVKSIDEIFFSYKKNVQQFAP